MSEQTSGELSTKELTETRYPCEQCGAMQTYTVGSGQLECQYCGHLSAIVLADEPIYEINYHAALRELQRARAIAPQKQFIQCVQCAAQFELEAHIHAGQCPFCGTSVVTGTGHIKPIKPKALLPFKISDRQAHQSYKAWLKGLWFAPSALKRKGHQEAKLHGVYIPYWTYDSDTQTSYAGMRGDVYYVEQRYTTVENGRSVTRTRMQPKIRWTPVSGRTQRHFNDVLVGATQTLPRKITDWLEPWDLQNLVPYNEAYLSGFSSEIYQLDLDEGFNIAQNLMENAIRSDVRQSIGGDQQRITHLHTEHSDTTFKHVLLPLWSASFQFGDKTYRFVVNGRNGKLRGERPYSAAKIALAVISAAALLGAGLYWLDQSAYW